MCAAGWRTATERGTRGMAPLKTWLLAPDRATPSPLRRLRDAEPRTDNAHLHELVYSYPNFTH